jgi:hypothetical protein
VEGLACRCAQEHQQRPDQSAPQRSASAHGARRCPDKWGPNIHNKENTVKKCTTCYLSSIV